MAASMPWPLIKEWYPAMSRNRLPMPVGRLVCYYKCRLDYLTIVLCGRKIVPLQVRQQKCVSLGVPRPVTDMHGVG